MKGFSALDTRRCKDWDHAVRSMQGMCVEGQQRRLQSAQRHVANALGKRPFVVDTEVALVPVCVSVCLFLLLLGHAEY